MDFIISFIESTIQNEKKIRFQLYNEIQIIIEKLEKLNLINDDAFISIVSKNYFLKDISQF